MAEGRGEYDEDSCNHFKRIIEPVVLLYLHICEEKLFLYNMGPKFRWSSIFRSNTAQFKKVPFSDKIRFKMAVG